MIELNINPVDSSGNPIPNPIITLEIYDANGKSCDIEPSIRPQNNFYIADAPFGAGIAPFNLYGTVRAPGYNEAFFGWLPDKWDGKTSLNIPVTMTPSFKRVPTRDEACLVRHHFQGLDINSPTYSPQYGGPLPWFTAALPAMDAVGELQNTLDQIKAVGDTHTQVDFEFNYGEAGQPWGTPQLVPDRSLTNDMPNYCRIVDTVISNGLKPIFVTPDGDIDWLHNNLARVHSALGNRTKYGIYQLGYDGGWPSNWTIQQVKDLLPFVRGIIGDTPLAMMFATVGGRPYFYVEDESDYSKPWMQCLDIILQSYGSDQILCPALVNGAQYMLGPALTPHDTCTPEFKGPFLLAPGTPRGPYYWGVDEWAEYPFDRNRYSIAQIDADRQRALSVGIKVLG